MYIEMPDEVRDALSDNEIAYVYYDNTGLVNAFDCRGVIQSFYVTTGTAMFRASNNKYEKRRETMRNWSISQFIKALNEPIV